MGILKRTHDKRGGEAGWDICKKKSGRANIGNHTNGDGLNSRVL